MMTRTARFGVAALATVALVGCGGVQGARDAASPQTTFTSSKKPDALAGCITTAWSTGFTTIPATTNRTERGWSVLQTHGGAVYGVADVDPSGTGSIVRFGSEYGATGKHIDGIKGCL
jgi:L-fucose isomerase-like protein